MSDRPLPRREAIRRIAALAAGAALGNPLAACGGPARGGGSLSEDQARLQEWTARLRSELVGSPGTPFGLAAVRVGELALGTPYEAFTLEEYIRAGDSPVRTEPLALNLTSFDCVSLVESCIAIARVARSGHPATWEAFAGEMERMRYRGGERGGYTTRLHYFSEWLTDNARRGLVRLLGEELGGVRDERPLRFMSSNPEAYPALAYPQVLAEIARIERELDDQPRWVVPTSRIPQVADRLQTGDILAFATSIQGLDVSHAAFAYRDAAGVMRVLHAPLSGGVVEITQATLPEYVSAIQGSTGILVARPLDG